jgi:phage baseplate assembly protein W
MPNYIGFNTQDVNTCKPSTRYNAGVDGGTGSLVQPITSGNSFKLVDSSLVIRDFLNALNIRQGEKVGQPEYGTALWSFVFEPNTADVQFQLENEIRRVASLDPRLILNLVRAYPQENGILVEVELAIAPFNQAQMLNVFFNNATNTAILR